jgi:phosphatidylserine/phosphatidylglycerophosphate/cardiolipin synthase-like enzyme
MKNNFALNFLFVILLSIISFGQSVVPISELKRNDANGVPIDTGKVFTVTGVVTASNQFGTTGGPASFQDNICGISIFGTGFSNQVNIGDSVTVTSVLTHFNGLTQFDFRRSGSSFIKHSSNHKPDTTVVTIAQIASQEWNGFEEYESLLIRINNVTISATGNFASGTNYNITDPTGTLIAGLRIDNSVTSLIGQQIPTGKVDIVGILGQYKNSAPYNSGYQIMPRFFSDIISDGSPFILNPVIAADVDTSSFKVYFNTARNGNSKVKYGLTSALELDSVVINDDTTYHVVPVSGLKQGTLYYFKAFSSNSSGTSSSELKTVSTASNDTTIGKINVYFNFSVDQSVAIPGNEAIGNVNFEEKLIERINAAKYSIDLALYSFQDKPNIATAIVAAKNRGVKVRVVYDSRSTQNSMQTLIDNGILISKRPPETQTFNGIMHNKFFVFDARDTIVTNDWVWTGSWNVTALESGWKNNVVEINDPTVAAAYTLEFEEMWGSNTETPNPSLAKFGYFKSNNTPHTFTVGGRPVKLYFSPSDGTTSKIINEVNRSNFNIYFATLSFTRSDITNAMNQRYNSGVTDIKGLINNINDSGSQYNNLKTFADVFQSAAPTLHHKYGVFDASYPESNPTTLTGSHNWSNAAENDNDENTLIIEDIFIANKFMQEFKKRYNESGGTGTFVIPITDVADYGIKEMKYQLFQNYPNPFNPTTTIKFEIPKQQHIRVSVYDILGREVKVLFDDVALPGIMAIDFGGQNLASGMYIYQLKADNYTVSRKMMLLK